MAHWQHQGCQSLREETHGTRYNAESGNIDIRLESNASTYRIERSIKCCDDIEIGSD